MERFLLGFICLFTPSRKLRHRIRKYANRFIIPIGNKIYLMDGAGNETLVTYKAIRRLGIDLKISGDNNVIKINRLIDLSKITMTIKSNDGFIEINRIYFWKPDRINIRTDGVRPKLTIGTNTTFNAKTLFVLGDDSTVVTGEDCMFSSDVIVQATDSHVITDIHSGQILNLPCGISIGKHCWIGRNAFINKNAVVSDNSIIGSCSVVNGTFTQPNIIIAGNPAIMIKKDINWDRRNISLYQSQI